MIGHDVPGQVRAAGRPMKLHTPPAYADGGLRGRLVPIYQRYRALTSCDAQPSPRWGEVESAQPTAARGRDLWAEVRSPPPYPLPTGERVPRPPTSYMR